MFNFIKIVSNKKIHTHTNSKLKNRLLIHSSDKHITFIIKGEHWVILENWFRRPVTEGLLLMEKLLRLICVYPYFCVWYKCFYIVPLSCLYLLVTDTIFLCSKLTQMCHKVDAMLLWNLLTTFLIKYSFEITKRIKRTIGKLGS